MSDKKLDSLIANLLDTRVFDNTICNIVIEYGDDRLLIDLDDDLFYKAYHSIFESDPQKADLSWILFGVNSSKHREKWMIEIKRRKRDKKIDDIMAS